MQKIILFLLLFLSAVNLSGQNSGKSTGVGSSNLGSADSDRWCIDFDTYGSGHFIEGELVDYVTKKPICGENDLILMTEDSVMIPDSLMTVIFQVEKKGKPMSFLVEIPKSGNYILGFTNPLYHTLYKTVKAQFEDGEHVKDIGKVEMKRKSMSETYHVLDEVVVKGTTLKFYFDNDTLIYNADAFTTQKGFILNDILKKMPGIVMDENGEIYANGQKIDVLLLDGKDFFDEDRKTILDNIPAYMVKNVKVYDSQKDSLDISDSSQGHIMDVTLKPEYHVVDLGNIGVGVGTDKRYMGKLFGLKYNDLGRLSFVASGNNVNTVETLGSDGDVAYGYVDDGFERVRDNVSMKYNIRKIDFSADGDVEYRYDDTHQDYSYIQHMMIDDADVNRNSVQNGNAYHNEIKTHHNLYLFGSRPYGFRLMPSLRFSRNKTNDYDVSSSFSKDVTDMLGENWRDSIKSAEICQTMMNYGQNRYIENAMSRRDDMDFKVILSKNYTIPNTGISASLNAYVNYNYNETNGMKISQYDYLQETPYRKQMTNYYNYKDENVLESYISTNFVFWLGKYHSTSLEYTFRYLSQDGETSYYALHGLNGMGMEYSLNNIPQADIQESVKDLANSYCSVAQNNYHVIRWQYNYHKDGVSLDINVPFRMEYRKYAYVQAYTDTLVRRKLIMPDVSVRLGKEWNGDEGKNVSCNLSYRLANSMPDMLDLVNRYNDINLLYRRKGNPELKNRMKHVFEGNLYVRKRIDNHSLNLSYTLDKNKTVNSKLYDMKTGSITTMPQNTSCDKFFRLNLSNKVYMVKNMFNVFSDFGFSCNLLKGFIDTDQSKVLDEKDVRHQVISENFGVGFTSRNTKCIASCSGYIEYNKTKSDIKTTGNTRVCDYGVKFDAAIECPWDIRLKSNLVTVNRQGYDIDKGNTMELIWSASLAKSFSENMTLSLECFDILNQRKSIRYYVIGNSRSEVHTNGIRRYGMLRFVYRFNSSKKQGNRVGEL